jgi:hypothetical protein
MLAKTEFGTGLIDSGMLAEKQPELPPNIIEPIPPEPPAYVEELERPRKPGSKLEYQRVRDARTNAVLYTEVSPKHGHQIVAVTLRDFDPVTKRCRVAILTRSLGGRPRKDKSNGAG